VELGAAAPPDWSELPPVLRRQIAAGTVQFWSQRNGPPPRLRVAIPEGPGGRLLFALLAAGWERIGIASERVAPDAKADLRLIDAVAPSDSAVWYLQFFSCRSPFPCSEQADQAVSTAIRAPSAAERAAALAQAQQDLVAIVPFLPIAQPLRWSLADPRLNGFQENARGVHMLNHLERRR
jgi:peptide/nickel transport system substrate-binding protein